MNSSGYAHAHEFRQAVSAFTFLVTVGVVFRQVRLRLCCQTPPNVPVDIWVPAVTVATQMMLLKITLW